MHIGLNEYKEWLLSTCEHKTFLRISSYSVAEHRRGKNLGYTVSNQLLKALDH